MNWFAKLFRPDKAAREAMLASFEAEKARNEAEKARKAMFTAARSGKLDTLKLLIERGANVDLRDASGWTVLGRVLDRNMDYDLDIVNVLVENGADVNMTTDLGTTALIVAIENGHLGAVRLLIEKGADVNCGGPRPHENSGNEKPLIRLIEMGDLDLVRLLIDKGADVNCRDSRGTTPLAAAKTMDITRALLSKGADVNAKIDGGVNALMIASAAGWIDRMRLFIDKGTKIDEKSEKGET